MVVNYMLSKMKVVRLKDKREGKRDDAISDWFQLQRAKGKHSQAFILILY